MPWPTVPVVTTGMDADTDTIPRADILDHTQKFNQLIAMRGVANGVCDLDASAIIPTARVGFIQSGTGAVARTAQDKARESVSVEDFGAVGDGVVNDRAAFAAANSATPLGYAISVPPGTYNFGGVALATSGRRWSLNGAVTFPNGKLTSATTSQVDTESGAVRAFYDSLATNWLQRSPYRLGSQYASAALSIGSGDPAASNFGTALFSDGHSNFLAFQPEERFNPVEINLYSAAATGRADTVVGTNRIQTRTDIYNNPFESVMVGKCLYFAGVKYRVTSFVSATEVGVELWDGTAVSFTAYQDTWHFTYSVYRGTCNVSGTTVTRTGGHIFPGYAVNQTSVLILNGVPRYLTGAIGIDSFQITENLGTLTNVEWIWYCEVDGETTALRMNHSNVGEQFNITTSACPEDNSGAGYYISSLAGNGFYRPIVIRNNNKDAISVVANVAASKAFVGIGTDRRTPACQLDVNGEIRSAQLSFDASQIEQFASNGLAEIAINYRGYAKGFTQFRDLAIYDGKGIFVGRFVGSTHVLELANPVSVTSDARQKTDIEAIPAAVLDAWGEVQRKRFKMVSNPDQRRYGFIAQEVIAVFERHGLDPYQDGPVRRDDEGNLSVSYTEAEQIEAEWIRRRIST